MGTPRVLSGSFSGGQNPKRDKKMNLYVKIGMTLFTLGFIAQLLAITWKYTYCFHFK